MPGDKYDKGCVQVAERTEKWVSHKTKRCGERPGEISQRKCDLETRREMMNLLSISGVGILCAKVQISIHLAGMCGNFY